MLAFAEGNLWAASRRSLSHLDPTSLQSIGTIPIAGSIVDLAATAPTADHRSARVRPVE